MWLMNLDKAITRQMETKKRGFTDASFAYIWTWCICHLSVSKEHIMAQMGRVLRQDRRANTIGHHCSFWTYYVRGESYTGVLPLLSGGFKQ